MKGQIGGILLVILILVGLVGIVIFTGLVPLQFFQSQFAVTSVSPNILFDFQGRPDLTNSFWVVTGTISGQGQNLIATLTPTQTEKFVNGKKVSTDFPLNIQIGGLSQRAVYRPSGTKRIVKILSFESIPAFGACSRTPSWRVGDFVTNYCVYADDVGFWKEIDSPSVKWDATIRMEADGKVVEKTISGDSGFVDLDGRGTVSWNGNLVTGDSPPSSSLFRVFFDTGSNSWSVTSFQNVDDYDDASKTAETFLSNFNNNPQLTFDLNDMVRLVNNNNVEIARIQSNVVTFLEGETLAWENRNSENDGVFVVTLDRVVQVPQLTLRLDADWVGVRTSVGQPQITSVGACSFEAGKESNVQVLIRNAGQSQGTFELGIQNCDVQSVFSGITNKYTLGSFESRSVNLRVQTTNLQAHSASCLLTLTDVNVPSIQDKKPVSCSVTATTVCTEGQEEQFGNTIRICQNGKFVDKENCQFGVTTDPFGKLVCKAEDGAFCGNNVCELGETVDNCPKDCTNGGDGIDENLIILIVTIVAVGIIVMRIVLKK